MYVPQMHRTSYVRSDWDVVPAEAEDGEVTQETLDHIEAVD